jgi:hypothetical protein
MLVSVRYTEENFSALQSFSGQRPTNKLEIQTDQNTGQQMTHLQDAASREFIVEEAVIDPGFSCEPAPGSDGEFKIFLGNRSNMEGAWFEPINYFPQLYEKIEWGVKLPDEVEAAIDNWIWNDQNPTLPPLVPALNPFDPEQIDLQAIVDYTTSEGVYYSQPVFAWTSKNPEYDSTKRLHIGKRPAIIRGKTTRIIYQISASELLSFTLDLTRIRCISLSESHTGFLDVPFR